MLTKLLPDQISKHWTIIKYAIQQSLPPTVGQNPDRLNRILSSALSSKIEVWASYIRGEENKFEGIVLTKLLYDDSSETRNLLIYCLYGYGEVAESSWLGGLEAILKYAKSQNCQQIIAYSDSPYIIDIVEKLGGDVSFRFLSFNVGDYNG
jgi:hypothetical protein